MSKSLKYVKDFDFSSAGKTVGYCGGGMAKKRYAEGGKADVAQDIDEGLWRDSVANARVAGAEFAPLHFLAGNLFSADILDVYERIPQPVWAVHGVRGDFTDYRRLAPLAAARGWRVTTYPTGALPYFEVGDAFQRDCTAFHDET